MMKKILMIFAILAMFISSNAYGAKNDGENKDRNEIAQWSDEILKDTKAFVSNSFDSVMSLTQDVTGKVVGAAWKKMSDFMNSAVIYTLIALIVCIWLIKLMRNGGEISKEEIYKAVIFVVIFAIVYAILSSKTAFNEVMTMFQLPSHLMQSIFGGQSSTQQALQKVFAEPFMETFNIFTQFYGSFTEKIDWIFGTEYLAGIPFAFGIISIYLFYILIALAVILAVIVIQVYSIFLTGIYQCFAPLVIFLLLIPQTKSIFFAWLKSYIGITMYVPLSSLAIQILAANPVKINSSNFITMTQQVFTFSLTGLLLAVLAITMLSKMPTWISELLAVGNQGVGMGGAIGLAKTAGSAVGSFAKKSALNPMKAMGGNLLNAGKTALSGDSVGQKVANFASSAASIASAGTVSKDGFKAVGKGVRQGFRNILNKLDKDKI